MDMTAILPVDCITHIISLTSPRDACRSSLVSPTFRSAADSDPVWERFLPSDYHEIISQSSSPTLDHSLSKKDLYFHLCHLPIFISNATMSFALEKRSGKKCYMIGARGLSIVWGNDSRYWRWTSLPESRFPEVAELKIVCWLDVKGKIETKILSPKTTYAAYLVYKFVDVESRFVFEATISVELRVNFEGGEGGGVRSVFLGAPSNMPQLSGGPSNVPQLSQDRGDGWMEVEMGEFFNENGDDGTVVCCLWNVSDYSAKQGLIVEAIEVRPK